MLALSALLAAAAAAPVLPAVRSASDYVARVQRSAAVQLLPEYHLAWAVSGDRITFTLTVDNAGGWIGFGIGELGSGTMPGSDMAVWSEVDGDWQLTDHYATGFSTPPMDADGQPAHWTLLSASTTGTVTTLVIDRPLLVDEGCAQDRSVLPGENAIVAAFGTVSVLSYHAADRRSARVTFYEPSVLSEIPSGPEYFVEDYRFPAFEVPDDDTAYLCMSVELPDYGQDAHIVAAETLFDGNPEADALLHHSLVYVCEGDVEDTRWPAYVEPSRCDFGHKADGDPGLGCLRTVAGWAPGQAPNVFPPEAGFRTSHTTPEALRYLLIEVHLDNPTRVTGLSTSFGMRFHMTLNLRPHDAGVLMLGDIGLSLPDIPPGEPRFHYETVCPSQCTRRFEEPITVFAQTLHMHQAGFRGWTTINGETEVLRTEFFSFAHQVVTEESYTIAPGDTLNSHFVWDTSSRTEPTGHGEASLDEMALNFLWYYPAQAEATCGYFGGITVCGNLLEANDILIRPNPGRDAEGPDAIEAVFGTEGECSAEREVVVQGLVFKDFNGNGVRDPEEGEIVVNNAFVKLLADSPGYEDSPIVRTDGNGRFRMAPVPAGGRFRIGSRNNAQTWQGVVDLGLLNDDAGVRIPLVPRDE